MKTFRRTIRVWQSEYDRLSACCKEGYVCADEDGYELDEEVKFPGGIRMAVQVCKARGDSCWTQGVLFDKVGNELGCTDCSDGIYGEFEIEFEDTLYSVEVIPKKEYVKVENP
jgi:hypothetical protein